MKPLPTPYDIIAPPTFAFVPSSGLWALPIILVVIAVAAALYLQFSERSLFFRRKRRRILQSYFRDFDDVATSYPPAEAAALARQLVRMSQLVLSHAFLTSGYKVAAGTLQWK